MAGLAVAYRPAALEEFAGNEGARETIETIFEKEDKSNVPHAIMLSGPSGCGKTTMARIVGSLLGSYDINADYNPDFREYNASNTRGIDTIRSIQDDASYAPMVSERIVYMMDECHALTKDAQNALLKLLEEPPDHVFFILCTTEPDKLLETIRTRCIKINVGPLKYQEMHELLWGVLGAEEIQEFPSELIEKIILTADGCPREALNLLDKVIDIEDTQKAMAVIEASVFGDTGVKELCSALLEFTTGQESRWYKVAGILKSLKDQNGSDDPEKIRQGVQAYLGKVLLDSKTPDPVAKVLFCFTSQTFMYSRMSGLYHACHTACKLVQ